MSGTEPVSLRSILVDRIGSGWLYLPDGDWTLETEGVFVRYGKDDGRVPDTIDPGHLQLTLDNDMIEGVISNAEQQVDAPTPDQLLAAFVYYVRNDAFIEF